MDCTDAYKVARSMMNEHGLVMWSFKFDTSKRRFGCCSFATKTISLSRLLVSMNTLEEVTITILHEIAHALCPRDVWHGPAWKAKCVELGILPNRCYGTADRNVVMARPNFYYGCANCGIQIARFRRSRRGVACSNCCNKYNGGKYTAQYLLKEVE
jgi:predicted SprT family Zn-dependent metalloprotease